MTAARTLTRRLGPPLLAASLLLAACGTDSGTETSASATSDAATDAPSTVATTASDPSTSELPDAESGEATGDATGEATGDATGEATGDATGDGGDDAEATDSSAPDVTATLADGSTISLADYAGQQVFVETFATWCSNCRRQLVDTATAASTASEEATFLALSVETELDPAELETYAQDNGFSDVTFGVLDAASLATLNDTFGNAVLVPPSTPKFVVAPDGSVSDLTTGFESVDEILAQVGDGA